MKLKKNNPPRLFSPAKDITIADCGKVQLSVNEQLTFIDDEGLESDFARKEWGYYLSNSLNHRLTKVGFKTAFFASRMHNPPSLYVCLVAVDKIDLFLKYLDQVDAELIMWLDEFNSSAVMQQR